MNGYPSVTITVNYGRGSIEISEKADSYTGPLGEGRVAAALLARAVRRAVGAVGPEAAAHPPIGAVRGEAVKCEIHTVECPVVSDNTDERAQWAIRDHAGTYGVSTTDERAIRRSWAQGITWWDPDGTYELCRRYGRSGPWEVVERHPADPDSGGEKGAGDAN